MQRSSAETVAHCSSRHSLSQPSPAAVPLSSHCSKAVTVPSPHTVSNSASCAARFSSMCFSVADGVADSQSPLRLAWAQRWLKRVRLRSWHLDKRPVPGLASSRSRQPCRRLVRLNSSLILLRTQAEGSSLTASSCAFTFDCSHSSSPSRRKSVAVAGQAAPASEAVSSALAKRSLSRSNARSLHELSEAAEGLRACAA